MKIVIEGSTLSTKGFTGIPHYILSLHKAFKNKSKIEVYLAFNLKKKRKIKPDVLRMQHFWYFKSILFSRFYKPQISHSLHSPFLKIRGTKKIATIHDLAVHLPEFEAYDFATNYFKNKRFNLFKDFAKNADAIISVSENTKNDFLKFFDYPEDRIHVIHLAPVFKPKKEPSKNGEAVLNRFGISNGSYFLSVGGVSLRKNSFNLLKGFAQSEKSKDFKLVFAGKVIQSEETLLLEYIKAHQLEEQVVFTKYISDDDLSVLYRNAKAFLFPTFYEGFGIPIIEAMTYELPVVTSHTGAAPEVANGHAILVDPFNPNDIAEGINKLDKVDSEMLKKAKRYAESFTWDKVADETIKVYQSLLS